MRNYFVGFILIFLLPVAMARTTQDRGWFIGVGAGAYNPHLSDSSTTVPNGSSSPAPFNQDLYTISSPSTKTAVQVNGGYRWHLHNKFISYSSVYLQYRHYNNANISGNIYQYSLPNFLNYRYGVDYSADLYTINGKLNLFHAKYFMPYVSAGIGFIVNRLDDYSETATANVTPRVSPGFAATNATQFAGTLGIGIDVPLSRYIWMTLGYDHVFQSNLPSLAGRNTWNGTSLNLGNIKLDTIFLNLSFKIPETFRSHS